MVTMSEYIEIKAPMDDYTLSIHLRNTNFQISSEMLKEQQERYCHLGALISIFAQSHLRALYQQRPVPTPTSARASNRSSILISIFRPGLEPI